ncbi:hypothetical protein HRG_002192 [Hirsutella rhossiliensis]|uniref:Rhodopsin domain-containing protein n=1 Tax=Hirsutella rhossiliensis TaxID=111463 RepID=A0A9P8SKU8_9HYPO|nr:uncharacterized protein HRG_02192 [Hirsutella rhossiliensis]KAH0966783.1 hypothetical protein HRG_02192 [Hirsutella rhossiliensis]
MSTTASGTLQTTPPLVSQGVFHGLVWGGFVLCLVAFCFRAYVRIVCFRRLFVDDWLMMGVLVILLAADIVCQLGLGYMYDIADPDHIPGPDFIPNTQSGLREFGASMILSYIGIWLIKLNFLLFFYRLGSRIRRYLITWWVVLVLTIACGAVELGIMQTKCMFGPILYIMTTCNLSSSMEATYTRFKVSCVLDVLTDAMIIGFPIFILWGVRISLGRKIALAGIFALVAFTIIVTIIRGSIFGGVYQSIDEHNLKAMNVSWIWFWFAIEFNVSYIIACLVSFRALFTQRDRKANIQQERKIPATPGTPEALKVRRSGFASRFKSMQNSLLDTCRTLEGFGRGG